MKNAMKQYRVEYRNDAGVVRAVEVGARTLHAALDAAFDAADDVALVGNDLMRTYRMWKNTRLVAVKVIEEVVEEEFTMNYVDFDEASQLWCVFDELGCALSTWFDEASAKEALRRS
jgi:hypothetical protein